MTRPPPPCTVRTVGANLRADKQGQLGDLMERDTSMDRLAEALRISAGRIVVNKTGLSGKIDGRRSAAVQLFEKRTRRVCCRRTLIDPPLSRVRQGHCVGARWKSQLP